MVSNLPLSIYKLLFSFKQTKLEREALNFSTSALPIVGIFTRCFTYIYIKDTATAYPFARLLNLSSVLIIIHRTMYSDSQ